MLQLIDQILLVAAIVRQEGHVGRRGLVIIGEIEEVPDLIEQAPIALLDRDILANDDHPVRLRARRRLVRTFRDDTSASVAPPTSAAAAAVQSVGDVAPLSHPVARRVVCAAPVVDVYSSSLEMSLLVSELLVAAAKLCSEVRTFRVFC